MTNKRELTDLSINMFTFNCPPLRNFTGTIQNRVESFSFKAKNLFLLLININQFQEFPPIHLRSLLQQTLDGEDHRTTRAKIFQTPIIIWNVGFWHSTFPVQSV